MSQDPPPGGEAPDRVTGSAYIPPVPVPVPGLVPFTPPTRVTYEGDNVNKVDTTPTVGSSGLVKTEWDAGSLDGAIAWLRSHAESLRSMYYGMYRIKEIMEPGGDIASTPLGGFKGATDMATKHSGLYTSAETAIKQLVEALMDAADGLEKVKEKYGSVEDAGDMTAANMQSVFSDLGQSKHVW